MDDDDIARLQVQGLQLTDDPDLVALALMRYLSLD